MKHNDNNIKSPPILKCGVVLLTLCVLVLSLSCEKINTPKINVDITTDVNFEEIAGKLADLNDAVASGKLSISQKMVILQEAVNQGTITKEEGYEKLVNAVNLAANTKEAKIELLKEAINLQTATFSDKIGILEKAVQAGIISDKERTALLKEALAKQLEAIKDQTGAIEEIIDSVGEIIKDGNVDLAAKLVLLEAAVTAGIESQEECTALMIEAVKAMSDSTGSRLDEISALLGSEAFNLTTAITLIEATAKAGFATHAEALNLIRSTVGSTNSTLANMLTLIRSAVDADIVAREGAYDLINDSLEVLGITLESAFNQRKLDMLNLDPAVTLRDKFDPLLHDIESAFFAVYALPESQQAAAAEAFYVEHYDLIRLAIFALSIKEMPDEDKRAEIVASVLDYSNLHTPTRFMILAEAIHRFELTDEEAQALLEETETFLSFVDTSPCFDVAAMLSVMPEGHRGVAFLMPIVEEARN